MRVVFMGTGEIGVPAFRWLLDSPEYEVVAAVTQPDKPVGRRQELQASAIKRLAGAKTEALAAEAAAVKASCGDLQAFLQRAMQEGPDFVQAGARSFAYSLARTCAASLLIEGARDQRSVEVARRWCATGLGSLLAADGERRNASRALL